MAVRSPLVRILGKLTQLPSGDTFPKASVGLDQVDNTSDVNKRVSTAQQSALDLKANLSLVGAANGIAPLGSDSKIAAAYLPSYVDDVLEVSTYSNLPTTGETGKIYVTDDTNLEYRWSGSQYIQLVASPGSTDAVPEGTTNLYFTAARVLATVLKGLSLTTSSAIAATDTVLSALGKLQAQITALTTSAVAEGTNLYFTTARVLATALSGLSVATSSAIAATDSVLVALGKLQAQITTNASTIANLTTSAVAEGTNLYWTVARGVAMLRANIVGTVSADSNGVPTGAIIERGSNSNGEYVKFADGTMICKLAITTSISVSAAYGTTYITATPYQWTFPASFAGAAPALSMTARVSGRIIIASQSDTDITNVTSANVVLLDPANSGTSTVALKALAIGRWK